MPKTLDILIGLATIMLFFSLAATMLTNGFIGLIGLRSLCLNHGLRRLLRQLWPGLSLADAEALATSLLLHPMIGIGAQFKWFPRQGTVIQREELFVLLLEFATGHGPDAQTVESLSPVLTARLRALLAEGGITDPGATLDQMRDLAQQLEASRPDLATAQRTSMAILATASSRFTAKLFGWFDQTIDRVSATFTAHTRLLAVLSALIITFTFQLDSVWMIQRLSDDPGFRQAMVTDSAGVLQAAATDSKPTPAQALPANVPRVDKALSDYGLIRLPFSTGANTKQAWDEWRSRWRDIHLWGGCLLSVLLLALGAPFWYGALQNLIKLKSSLSSLDDQQRTDRQTYTGPDPTAVAAVVPAAPAVGLDLTGERGDLNALG